MVDGGGGATKLKPGRIRIISGRLRGRIIDLSQQPDAVKPTPDRVRETLFNWLGHRVVDARCLDTFAGSGVLGLEALSRGAASVVFADALPAVVLQLQSLVDDWQLRDRVTVIQQAMPPTVTTQDCQGPFDVVFLDPPYGSGLAETSLAWLLEKQCLNENAVVAVETAKQEAFDVPAHWECIRQMQAGQVCLRLLGRSKSL